MGNNHPFEKFRSGFGEVASKVKWRQGLSITICDCGEVKVIGIRGLNMGPPAGTLMAGEQDKLMFKYYYAGDQIEAAEIFPLYEIIIQEVNIHDKPGCTYVGGCDSCKKGGCTQCKNGGCDSCKNGGCDFCGKK